MNDFLVTIPSDFYSSTIKDNKISNFKIDYEIPFNLSDDYMCGLVEIIYPTSVRNIPDDVKFSVYFQMDNKMIVMNKFNLATGSYDKPESLSNEMTKSLITIDKSWIKKFLKNYIEFQKVKIEFSIPTITHSNNRMRVTQGYFKIYEDINNNNILVQDLKLFLVFDDYLHSMLGFEENNIERPEGVAKYPVDLFGNNHSLYLYTNIVRESFVGNKKSQILRVIPLEKVNDADKIMKSITFNPILFYPLRLHKFDLIEIQIRDSTGRLVIFESGRIVITLMFKKKSSIKYE